MPNAISIKRSNPEQEMSIFVLIVYIFSVLFNKALMSAQRGGKFNDMSSNIIWTAELI